MRVIVLTSDFPRHVFLASYLAERLDVVGIWQEQKSFEPDNYARTPEELRLIAQHFEARDQAEERDFALHTDALAYESTLRHTTPPNGLNDPGQIEAMVALDPEAVVVFGTGILRAGIINAFGDRLVNLHLGISPYYRGAGTNFWPLVNREPEYVGATIHQLDAGIDTGPVFAHARPELHPGDGPHDIGNRAIRAAAEVMVEVLHTRSAGPLKARPQSFTRGRFYQRKDFNADAVRELYRQFDTGMVEEYLENRVERDQVLRLVGIETAREC